MFTIEQVAQRMAQGIAKERVRCATLVHDEAAYRAGAGAIEFSALLEVLAERIMDGAATTPGASAEGEPALVPEAPAGPAPDEDYDDAMRVLQTSRDSRAFHQTRASVSDAGYVRD